MELNEELVRRIIDAHNAGDIEKQKLLLERLFKLNEKLVIVKAFQFQKLVESNEDKEDIYQIACEAFIQAVFSYDNSKSAFSTWATKSMDFALKDYLRNNSLVVLPPKLRALVKEYKRMVSVFIRNNNGQLPSKDRIYNEMAKKITLNRALFQSVEKALKFDVILSLDELGGNGIISDINPENIEEMVISKIEAESVREKIRNLPNDYQLIVNEVAYKNKKQTALAKELGTTKQNIQNKYKNAIRKLQKELT